MTSFPFTRAKGKEVMEAFLKSPQAKDINVLFAHNDDMALGAIQAMEEAGIKPGQDIKIVSIDGVRGAFEAMKDGKLNVTVECNPLLGPQLFDLIEKIANKLSRIIPAGILESAHGVCIGCHGLPNRRLALSASPPATQRHRAGDGSARLAPWRPNGC